MQDNQYRAVRVEKLEKLKALGVDPYPAKARATDRIEALVATHAGATGEALEASPVSAATMGRVTAYRDSGKTCFLNLSENGAKLQVYLRKDALSEQDWEVVRLLDLGDFIAVSGTMMRTRTGELTLKAASVQFLTKALLPFLAATGDASVVYLGSVDGVNGNPTYPAYSASKGGLVNLTRALAVEPKVLLLDEPFGALDTKVRKELRRWLRRLHDDMHISSVFVTHDQEEALEVADRVVVMNHGRIEQIGSPDEVYSAPATPFVYQFLGNVNVFHSRVQGGFAAVERNPGEGTTAFVRPHDIDLSHQPLDNALPATVAHVHPIGPVVRVELLPPILLTHVWKVLIHLI